MSKYFVAVLIVFTAFVAGCDEKSDVTGPSPTPQVTLSTIQRDIFDTTDASGRQACTGCHTDQGRNPAGGMNLRAGAAHASLVGVASTGKAGATRVIARDPENSYLIHKLEGRDGIVGTRMPRGTVFLTDAQVQQIKSWIAAGALNN